MASTDAGKANRDAARANVAVGSTAARHLLLRYLARTGKRSLVRIVDSGSMAPLVNSDGLYAEVEWGALDKLVPGELVVVATPPSGLLIVHRSVAWRQFSGGRELLQLPDSDDAGGGGVPGRYVPLPSGYESPWTPEVDILGRVVRILSLDGRTVRYDIHSRLTRLTNVVARELARRIWNWSEVGAGRREWAARRLRNVTLRGLVLLGSRPWSTSRAPQTLVSQPPESDW
jgi:hypothetical protein